MFDLKKFLDVDKLKNALGKKSDASSEVGERTENIHADEDKIDAQISSIENEEKKQESSEAIPFFKDRKKIIRVVIILAVAYLIVDQFVLTTDEPDPFANSPVPVKKNKNKRKNKTATATEATIIATESASSTGVALSQDISDSDKTPNSAVSEVPIAPTPIAEATMMAEMSPAPEPTPEMTPEATPEQMSTPEMISGMGETTNTTQKKNDFGNQLNEMVSSEGTPAPKKLEVKEYVAPPQYNLLGRGLVYNCKGKHWACIDKDSYLSCRQNEIWQRSVGKLPECSARNVYSSIDDCKIVQTHNINTTVRADFCK